MTLRVRTKLVAGFGAVLFLMLAVGFFGWWYTATMSAELESMYENNLKAAVHLSKAEDALWRLRYGFPQFLVLTSSEDRRKVTDEEPKLYALISEQIKVYEGGKRTPEERQALKEWTEISTKYFEARPKWFNLIAAGKMEEAAQWRAATTTPFGAASVKALGRLIDLQRQVAEARHRDTQGTARTSIIILVGLLAVAMIVGMTLAGLISRSVTGPLSKTVDMMKKIAEEGDLTRRVEVKSQDELGEVAHWFNTMIASIHAIIVRVRETAEHTAAASQQLSSASSQLNQFAVSSRNTAERGGQVVSEAVAAMTEISKSSRRIADIITTIDEIAFQTNLLALNAAVEAARAGEQGRGFAVVASEVRNLAQRSASAAREIKTLTQDSLQKVESGSALVNKSGQQLAEIVSAVKRVTDIVTEIAGANQEQSAGIDQVNRAVSQMDRVVQSNATQTRESTTTARALATQAQELRSLVEQFKVERRADRGGVTSHLPTPTVAGRLDPDRRSNLKPSRVAEAVLLGTGAGSVHDNGDARAEF